MERLSIFIKTRHGSLLNHHKRKDGILGVEDEMFEAHLVAKGFIQIKGVDFNELFFLVVKYSSIQVLVALFDLELEQINIKIIFLLVSWMRGSIFIKKRGFHCLR